MPNFGTHLSGPVRNTAKKENSNEREWFSNLPLSHSDPDFFYYTNDFSSIGNYNTTDWTLTLVGTGTVAVSTTTNSANGTLLITTGAANGPDSNNVQLKEASWLLDSSVGANDASQAGKRLWFETKLRVSNVADVDLFIGLAQISTTVQSANDRVGFRMTTGAALLNVETSVGGVATSVSSTQSMVAATDIRLGFMYEGGNSVRFFVNRGWVKTVTTNLPTAVMAPGIYVAANSANARTSLVDYFSIHKER